jgi:L-cysteine S-thiosulfotransferase
MKMKISLLAGAVLLLANHAAAQQMPKADPAAVEKVITATFKGAPADWQARIVPDETQKLCSLYRNELPADQFAKVLEREKAAVVMPADGRVLGDWKNGEKLAQRGTGGQFSDTAETAKGGNCYACHQMEPKELSYGTLGPSLLEYGKIRKFADADAKAAYAKIFNAQSVQPCSNMPRFGHNKFLTEQDMKDVTAYLFDPESPVNK